MAATIHWISSAFPVASEGEGGNGGAEMKKDVVMENAAVGARGNGGPPSPSRSSPSPSDRKRSWTLSDGAALHGE